MAQVYFDVNSFSGATVQAGRSFSIDDFYFEMRNILLMKSLTNAEKREALNITLRNTHE